MSKNEVAVITKQASPAVEKAEALEIRDAKTMTSATELLSELNQVSDRAEEEKQKTLKPANETVKQIRAQWKPLESALETAIGIIRKKMSAYQTEHKRIADEKAAKIEARVSEGRGNLKFDTAVAQIEKIDKPADLVEANAGSVKFRTDKKFEVVDLKALPIEYHLADEVAIRAAMKAGTELPGVRYYTEEVPINSR